jgi:hypothetical protein
MKCNILKFPLEEGYALNPQAAAPALQRAAAAKQKGGAALDCSAFS